MAISILEALQDANNNMKNRHISPLSGLVLEMAEEQLNNAVTLLVKGYNLDTEIEPLLEEYGDVENVPDL